MSFERSSAKTAKIKATKLLRCVNMHRYNCIVVVLFAALSAKSTQAQYNCVTPENYYGSCVILNYCPQVANIFKTTNRQAAQNYVLALQRSCGTRSMAGEPVICCLRPTITPNVRPTQAPVTSASTNPFLPTAVPQRPRNPQPITRPPPISTTTISRPVTSAPLIDTRARSCLSPDFRDGYCIELKDCAPLVEELYVKSSDPTFANYLRTSNQVCGGIGSVICCTSGSSGAVTAAPITRAPVTNDAPRRLPSVQEGCGYTLNSYKKIVGGEVSKRGAWPWVALLGYDDGSASPFKCGGTLITARHVITAAHCVLRALSYIRLGEHDLSTDAEAQHVDIKIARSESHPEYNKQNGRSDIAILYLVRNVQFTDFISPICLPNTPELRTKTYVRHTPFVVGWGKTMEGGISANVLQELQIPIYDNEVCRDRYQKQNRLFSTDQFDAAVICAGVLSGGKDTCQGDSGGPLMIPEAYKDNVRYYLLGVVSYGIGCARPEVPGVYTSTQYFIDWISQMVANTP